MLECAKHLHRMRAGRTSGTHQIEGRIYEITIELIYSPEAVMSADSPPQSGRKGEGV